MILAWIRRLAYGENRYQSPADLFSDGSDDPLAISKMEVLAGDPSYVSTADFDSGVQVLCLMAESFRRIFGRVPHIAVACKHGNPCGAAFDWNDPGLAIHKMLMGDPLAVMGGEVVTNFPLDGELALALHIVPLACKIGRDKWGLDFIAAPDFDEAAITTLEGRTKKPRRLVRNPALLTPTLSPADWIYRPVRGGFIRQRPARFILDRERISWHRSHCLDEAQFETLPLVWATCWSGSSNSTTLGRDRMLLSRCFGQQDRVACNQFCLDLARRSGHALRGSLFGTDGHFPYAQRDVDWTEVWELAKQFAQAEATSFTSFADQLKTALILADKREGPQLLADAGCIGGIVPADGQYLAQVQDFFAAAGMAVAYVEPNNRGFCRH